MWKRTQKRRAGNSNDLPTNGQYKSAMRVRWSVLARTIPRLRRKAERRMNMETLMNIFMEVLEVFAAVSALGYAISNKYDKAAYYMALAIWASVSLN